jgi:L-fuconolactonase
MTLLIDAHQHYWNPARGDYFWMPKGDPVLDRAYMPHHLDPQLKAAGIEKTVLVQAAPTVNETEFMLGIADASDTVAKVVGWVDFENRDDLRHLERLKAHPKFAGVRPMIQDIADTDWMLRPDIRWAFEALVDLDLTFDALGFSRHLGNFLTVFQRHPGLRVVVDHCMKPQIRDHGTARDEFKAWSQGMGRIARETQAVCKFSALVTEDIEAWSTDRLRPYAELILEAFGPSRVMWGSDWPVCRLRCEHGEWLGSARALTHGMGHQDRAEIFGGTAARFYGIG